MAAYHRVYDSRHLQADCQESGSALELYSSRADLEIVPILLAVEYGLPLPFYLILWVYLPSVL